jgi:hypothetical protein
MDEIINRLERIEKKLDNIQKHLDYIENNDENHRQFINNVYDNIRRPFQYFINKIAYFSNNNNINNIELPNRIDNLMNNVD